MSEINIFSGMMTLHSLFVVNPQELRLQMSFILWKESLIFVKKTDACWWQWMGRFESQYTILVDLRLIYQYHVNIPVANPIHLAHCPA